MDPPRDNSGSVIDLRLRRRFRIEVVLAGVSAALLALTLVLPDWIEALTGLDPDGGSGALEWIIAGTMFAVAVASALLARRDHRQLALSHR